MKKPSVSVIIPAAGESGRMGSDKPLLAYSPGLNFTDHLINAYLEFGADPIMLVVNRQFDASRLIARSAVCVVNEHVDRGRSWSIRLGIGMIPAGNACFIHNVDNPYAERTLLEALMHAVSPGGYVVPVYDGKGGHPVLLGSRVVEYLRNASVPADFRKSLEMFQRNEIPFPDERILLNINTPSDYENFRKMI
ncbi:MAG: NTP transferase domain-containing protein [Bacteroidetes bacterium]|nr:NTP transferase domain-containing protein [Bacteroidota bacterium]